MKGEVKGDHGLTSSSLLSQWEGTVQALKELDVEYIVPMHCSGAGFIRAVQRELPDRLIMSYTGTRYIFGA